MTVLEATRKAYDMMPNEFSTNTLIRKVRQFTGRPGLFDATILRRLRELREEGRANYEVLDSMRSIYKKKSPGKQMELWK